MILVTGATGRTGSEVVKALIAKGEQVRALVRDPQRAGAIRQFRAMHIPGSLNISAGDCS